MEPSETVLSSYYHHSQPPPPPPPPQQQQPSLSAASPPPPNGTVSAKKRGRPRKYNTPEEAAAARRAQLAQPKKPRPAAAVVSPISAAPAAGGISFSPSPPPPSAAKANTAHFPAAACGNVGQSFTPHIISVAAGEDVYQKIMLFMQQSKREICILSASGSISSPFLRQPATSGGNVTYEGRFDILSLSGSYIRTDLGGRTGGLSVCLSSADGQIIGGGVGGPLRAAGPVEVIVGTFLIDMKKDLLSASKGMEQMV